MGGGLIWKKKLRRKKLDILWTPWKIWSHCLIFSPPPPDMASLDSRLLESMNSKEELSSSWNYKTMAHVSWCFNAKFCHFFRLCEDFHLENSLYPRTEPQFLPVWGRCDPHPSCVPQSSQTTVHMCTLKIIQSLLCTQYSVYSRDGAKMKFLQREIWPPLVRSAIWW